MSADPARPSVLLRPSVLMVSQAPGSLRQQGPKGKRHETNCTVSGQCGGAARGLQMNAAEIPAQAPGRWQSSRATFDGSRA